MKLYELTEEFNRLESMVEDIDSEQDSSAFTQLWDEINGKFEDKAESTACVIRNLEAQAKAIEEEEKRLRSRRKALEGGADRLKTHLESHMTINGIPKITGKLFTISIQKNPPALKVDQASLPDDWWIIKREPDNSRIKEALRTGATVVQGAWLEQGQSLRIR
jgi:hypothetical protein